MSRFLPAASAAVLCTLLLGACTGSGNGTRSIHNPGSGRDLTSAFI